MFTLGIIIMENGLARGKRVTIVHEFSVCILGVGNNKDKPMRSMVKIKQKYFGG